MIVSSIYIRPIKLEDALVSYEWRNNPKIWRFTGSKPDRYITPEIETAWLLEKLKLEDEKRFAICLKSNDQYIGNANLTDIKNGEAQYHIFIGLPEFWGGNRAYETTTLVWDYGFGDLGLETIWMAVNKNNLPARKICQNMGFVETEEASDNFVKFTFHKQMYDAKVHLAWYGSL